MLKVCHSCYRVGVNYFVQGLSASENERWYCNAIHECEKRKMRRDELMGKAKKGGWAKRKLKNKGKHS